VGPLATLRHRASKQMPTIVFSPIARAYVKAFPRASRPAAAGTHSAFAPEAALTSS